MRRVVAVVLGLMIGVVIGASCAGCIPVGLIDAFVAFFAGWAHYPLRVVPEITVDIAAVATALIALVLFAVGLHRMCIWLYRKSDSQSGKRQWKRAWSSGLVWGILLMFCAGMAGIGVVHQIVWLFTSKTPMFVGGREPYYLNHSRNNLKQVGIALHNYHDAFTSFPAGATFDPAGRPLHSWVTQSLPYWWEENKQTALSEQIQYDIPWDDPRNAKPFQQSISALVNPGVSVRDEWILFNKDKYALAHYAANVLVVGPGPPLQVTDITDGTYNTFLAGEVNSKFRPWGDPFNFRDVALGINKSPYGFGSPFKGGAIFLRADGSVQFINENVDPDLLKATATPDGGEAETIPAGIID